MKEKTKNYVVRSFMWVIALMIAVMMAVTVVTMANSDDNLGMVTNLAFLAVMAILLYKAGRDGLNKMIQTGDDCQQIFEWIKKKNSEGLSGESLWDYTRRNTIKFEDHVVNAQWMLYLSGHMQGDASAYLDVDEIMEHYEKNYCDMVPGLLTALGILGTFLGLIMGIGSFSVGDANALENALAGIISGINVAFYTSVYGVALSIAFNLIYRICQRDFREQMYKLHSCLETYFKTEEIHDAGLQLVDQAKEQQLELKNIRQLLEDDMAEVMGEKIAETLEPVMEEINLSLKRVVGDFRQEQAASLQRVVEAFVVQMRTALDSHINELGKSVEKLSISQKEMSDDMRILLREIGTTATDTRAINQEAEMILRKFEEYLERINTMMTVANNTFYSVEQYSRQMYESSVKQYEIVQSLGSHEKKMEETQDGVVKVYEDMMQTIHENTRLVQLITEKEEVMAESQQKLVNVLNQYAQGTVDVFMEMKSAQLAASAQYQNSWKILEKMMEREKELQEQQAKGAVAMSDKDMFSLMRRQNELLYSINEQLSEQERRRENSLPNRLQKQVGNIFTKRKK